MYCVVALPCDGAGPEVGDGRWCRIWRISEFQSPKTKKQIYTTCISVDIKIEKRFSFTLYHLVLLSNCLIVHFLNHRLIVLC